MIDIWGEESTAPLGPLEFAKTFQLKNVSARLGQRKSKKRAISEASYDLNDQYFGMLFKNVLITWLKDVYHGRKHFVVNILCY